MYATLVKNADNTYTYTTKDNLTFRFDVAGVLTSLEDINGNDIALTYGAQGRLTAVAQPGGAVAHLQRRRPSPRADGPDHRHDSGMTPPGDLRTVTDAENGVRSYTYVITCSTPSPTSRTSSS